MKKVNLFVILWVLIGFIFLALLVPSFILAFSTDSPLVYTSLSLVVLMICFLFGYGVRLALLLPTSYKDIMHNS